MPAPRPPSSRSVTLQAEREAHGHPGPCPGAADRAESRVPGHTAPTTSTHSQLRPPRALLLDAKAGSRLALGPGLLTEATRAAGRGSGSPHLVGDMQLRAQSRSKWHRWPDLGVVSQKEAGLAWTPAVTLFRSFSPSPPGAMAHTCGSGVIAEKHPGSLAHSGNRDPRSQPAHPADADRSVCRQGLSGGERAAEEWALVT